ncbi:hypothetical protein 1 [Hubei orthoptera virus 5]|uniref:Uncharacterized protein n=1 Tax=Hubei orthoptera virus 5 TaxID=1923013 RepID=A0A1L3KNA8_9MONO|nr:hypothetical protein 1 [Hubei orthoptera virus 5]APG78858.1 hypothetical protein 1 [Hubei orthoptera virus 5]
MDTFQIDPASDTPCPHRAIVFQPAGGRSVRIYARPPDQGAAPSYPIYLCPNADFLTLSVDALTIGGYGDHVQYDIRNQIEPQDWVADSATTFTVAPSRLPVWIGIDHAAAKYVVDRISPVILSAPPESDPRLEWIASYWLNLLVIYSPPLARSIRAWALAGENPLYTLQEVQEKYPPAQGTVVTPIAPLHQLIHTYFAMTLGFKNVNSDYISDWAQKRANSMLAGLGLDKASASAAIAGNFPTAAVTSTFFQSHPTLLRFIIDFVTANLTECEDPGIQKLCSIVDMILNKAGMATIESAYNFAKAASTAASFLPRVAEQSVALIEIWEAMMKDEGEVTQTAAGNVHGLGAMFPYARALGLRGVELLNVGKYADLAYCAWFQRADENPTYRNMAHSQATDQKTLAAHTKVPLSIGYTSLTETVKKFLDERGISEAQYTEGCKQAAKNMELIKPEELRSNFELLTRR